MTPSGADEGRTVTYWNAVADSVFDCPHCHYAGELTVFKIKDCEANKYYKDSKLDLPNAEQVKAIRTMLAKRKDLYSGKRLYPVERFVLAEQCLKLQTFLPQAILDMSLMCAWMCDDAGQDAMAVKYRKQAIAACVETLQDKSLSYDKTVRLRKLRWVLTSNIGQCDRALVGLTKLLADVWKNVATHRKTMPPKLKGYRGWDPEFPYDNRPDVGDIHRKLFGNDDSNTPAEAKTRAKQQKIWTAWMEFEDIRARFWSVEEAMFRVRYKTLDQAGALTIASKGGYRLRYAFAEVFKSSEDPKVIAEIKAFADKPTKRRPKLETPYDFEQRQSNCMEGVLLMILEGNEASDELRKYAIDKGMGQHFVSFSGVDDGKYKYDPDEFKDVPSADMAKSLARTWANINTKKSNEYFWEVPRDILAELARRSDKDAIAALTADFYQHIDWYAEIMYCYIVKDWFPKSGNPPGTDYSWEAPAGTDKYYWGVYRIIARDPKLATEGARRLIERIKGGKLYSKVIVSGIMPLGFLKTKESRQLLVEACELKDPTAVFTAAKCLLMRNDPAGKDALLNVIVKRLRWDAPSDKTGDTFTRMLDAKDAAVLGRLARTHIKKPKLPKQPSDYNKKGFGVPIRLIASLAKLDKKQVGVYEAFIANLSEPRKRPKDGDWSKAIGGYDVDALMDASRVFNRPSIERRMAAALEHISDERKAPELIAALARVNSAYCLQTISKQLDRPIALPVKAAIIEASAKANIPGLSEKLIEWSRSRNEWLAEIAQAALARKNKAQK